MQHETSANPGSLLKAKACHATSQFSAMEKLTTIVNGQKPLFVAVKLSILDWRRTPGYTFL